MQLLERPAASSLAVAEELAALLRLAERSVSVEAVAIERGAYVLLSLLSHSGPLRTGAVASHLHLSPSTVSRQVGSLERAGFVQRVPDPVDGRAFDLQITEHGRLAFAQARQARMHRLHAALGSWSEVEVAELAAALRRLNRELTRDPATTVGGSALSGQHRPADVRTSGRTAPRIDQSGDLDGT